MPLVFVAAIGSYFQLLTGFFTGADQRRIGLAQVSLLSRLRGPGLASARQEGLAHPVQHPAPVSGGGGPAAKESQPVFQMSPAEGKGKKQGANLPAERGAEHGGAQDVVGQQTGQPFFPGHLGRFAFQLDQAHLGFEVAQV